MGEEQKYSLERIPFSTKILNNGICSANTLINLVKLADRATRGHEQKAFGVVYLCGRISEICKTPLFGKLKFPVPEWNVNDPEAREHISRLVAVDGGWHFDSEGNALSFATKFHPEKPQMVSMPGGTKHNGILQTTTEQQKCFGLVVSEDSEGEITIFFQGTYDKFSVVSSQNSFVLKCGIFLGYHIYQNTIKSKVDLDLTRAHSHDPYESIVMARYKYAGYTVIDYGESCWWFHLDKNEKALINIHTDILCLWLDFGVGIGKHEDFFCTLSYSILSQACPAIITIMP